MTHRWIARPHSKNWSASSCNVTLICACCATISSWKVRQAGLIGMNDTSKLIRHYGRDDLIAHLSRALNDAGLNHDRVSWADLAALDQFHTRGLDATVELAELAGISPGAKVIDIGSGLGGPSRYLAANFNCTVKGVDLSPEFVGAATFLAIRCGLEGIVEYQCANALNLPFEDASFDIAWSQHVAMNIADRGRLYSEILRVLRPGGRFAVYDVTAGEESELVFPVPWSPGADTSFLLSAEKMRSALLLAGFRVETWADRSQDGIDWFDNRMARASADSSSRLGIQISMGPEFPAMAANLERNLREGRIRLTEAILLRP